MLLHFLPDIQQGNIKSLARCISLIENEAKGYEDFLRALPISSAKIIGVTGPPGAGKSTLTDALIGKLVEKGKKIAVLCVDPSSPFNMGALLGDRIRMSEWYNHPMVFIRSLATRGSLGGLNSKIIEITDLLKAAAFDFIIVETVGVGQSEVEIAGLADTTIVVLVPESGDEIQTMKSGLMEIADIFVVNKSDRPDADQFVKNLQSILAHGPENTIIHIPVIKTIASQKKGVEELAAFILQADTTKKNNRKKALLTEKAYQLIINKRMKDVSKNDLTKKINQQLEAGDFNLYSFIENY
jgi:LAO/AO transport system kinase